MASASTPGSWSPVDPPLGSCAVPASPHLLGLLFPQLLAVAHCHTVQHMMRSPSSAPGRRGLRPLQPAAPPARPRRGTVPPLQLVQQGLQTELRAVRHQSPQGQDCGSASGTAPARHSTYEATVGTSPTDLGAMASLQTLVYLDNRPGLVRSTEMNTAGREGRLDAKSRPLWGASPPTLQHSRRMHRGLLLKDVNGQRHVPKERTGTWRRWRPEEKPGEIGGESGRFWNVEERQQRCVRQDIKETSQKNLERNIFRNRSGNHLDGNDEFDEHCKCKNYMETPRTVTPKISVEKWILSGSSHLTPPMSGIWMRRLGSPRPRKVSLLHIRPIMASPMMPCLAPLQTYEMSMLGMQRNLHKEKPQLIPKRGVTKERWTQDGFMLKKIET
ncbi:hypothetical protein HPG69_018139 [Diceros bicornis minor]|uniref:Uncharacterized protein n=1 Tax=Diceros bicornis minor TaxID=77932 RepID=A0A7J7EJJ1_DICBM|nr:hypothetical protein HPG69_018139 [Diceros bicornis minor]